MDWVRVRDLPKEYPIGLTYAKNLVREFRAQNKDGWIKDGKIMMVRKEDFERWWKQRSQNRQLA